MRLKISLLIIASLFTSGLLTAQNKVEGNNYVFVISKVNYLLAIDDAIAASTKNGELKINDVRVILCGESVKAFQERNPLIEKVLNDRKITLLACGLSLDQIKIDPSILPAKVKVVPNGLLEAMILESKGYKKYDL